MYTYLHVLDVTSPGWWPASNKLGAELAAFSETSLRRMKRASSGQQFCKRLEQLKLHQWSLFWLKSFFFSFLFNRIENSVGYDAVVQ